MLYIVSFFSFQFLYLQSGFDKHVPDVHLLCQQLDRWTGVPDRHGRRVRVTAERETCFRVKAALVVIGPALTGAVHLIGLSSCGKVTHIWNNQ